MSKFFHTLRFKLALIVVAAVVVAMFIAALAHGWREAGRRYTSVKSEVTGIAATLATAVAPAQAKKNRREVQSILRAIRKMPRITYASVNDMSGRRIAFFGNGIVLAQDAEAVRKNDSIGLLKLLSLKTYPVAVPIIDGGLQVGTLSLIGDVSELGMVLNDSLKAALLGSLFASLFGFLIAFRLQRMVTRPILGLTRAMRDIQSTNDFSRTVSRTSRDETGDLVEAFNDMLSQIRNRDAALAHHRETLEQTVEERTSELRHATKVAQEANAAKSVFLATMSHEIRTPMNGMLVMAELLSAGGLSPRLRRYADVIVSSGQSLLSIINDILDFSKIEAGRMELERVPVAPRELADQVTRLFSQRAASKCVDIAAMVDQDVPLSIAADPVRLNQVLSNLVNNALKFTETGGVMVHISRTGGVVDYDTPLDEIKIAVTDTGIGIPEHKITQIFDAFSQADQSTTRKYGGTGIGLSICQKLVTCMGGEIDVSSELGEGSTFSFSVPVHVLAEAPTAQIEKTNAPEIAILLDDVPTRSALAAYAQQNGYQVSDASNIDSILEVPAGITALIAKPETIKKLQLTAGKEIQIIALSGLGMSETDQLLEIGQVNAQLTWPISNEQVTTLLDRLRRGEPLVEEYEDRRERRSEDRASFDNVHVLAADDNIVNREVLREALHRLNVIVTCVEDGRAALEAVKHDTFDLVFMDGSMPLMDGFESTRAIRAWEKDTGQQAMPVIALTAHVIGSQSQLWRDAGMSDCVTKPFTLNSIEACLQKWLPETAANEKQAPPADQEVELEEHAEQSQETMVPILDTETLDNIAAMEVSDSGLVNRVISLYIEHAPPALNHLEKVVRDGQVIAIADSAHALKSLSLNIGARRVSDICETIESRARAGDGRPSNDQLNVLKQALDETLSSLTQAQQTKRMSAQASA